MNNKSAINRTLIVFVVLFLGGCSTPLIDANLNVEDKAEVTEAFLAELSKYGPNLVEGFRDDLENFSDASRYMIDLEIGESVSDVSGSMEVVYTNTESVPLEEIYFRLFPNVGGEFLVVENFEVYDQPAEIVLENKGTSIRVDIPVPLMPGDSVAISMDFTQNVPTVMGGNYGLYIFMDDILALDAFFPIIPVYNEEGWNVEDPPRNADMIFTDAAFFEVHVSAPQDLVLVASGVETGLEVKEGKQTVTFVAGPQRDFYIAASQRYVSESMNVGGTLVSSYFPEEYREMGLLVLNTAVKALMIFSEEFGSYPYAELDLVSTPMQAGGMEYSGAAAMALYLYEPDITFGGMPGAAFLESATAHEVAHQWFFNQVMNDQIDEPWLDEGFAQYATSLYFLGEGGDLGADSYRESWRVRWSRENFAEIPIGLPASAYEPRQYSPIIYGRAPIFIKELEELMGAEVFGELLGSYIDAYRWKIVNTQDFLSLAEQTCRCELDDLFNEYGVIR
jgi:hypothetical protein